MNGRHFNAKLSFQRLRRRFQQLLDFSANGMEEDEDFECLWNYANFMLIRQVSYLANFQNFTNIQLIDVFSSVIVRLEIYDFVNKLTRPLDRLKLTLRKVVTILRANPDFGSSSVW